MSVSHYLQCPPDGHFVRRDEWCAKECGGWENDKCKHGGTEWAIIPESEHLKVQAALAAAEEFIEDKYCLIIHEDKIHGKDEADKVLTQIRKVKE